MLATIVLVIDVPDVTIAEATKQVERTTDTAAGAFPDARFASVKVGVTALAASAGFDPTALGDPWLVYHFPDETEGRTGGGFSKIAQRRLVATAATKDAAAQMARALGADQIQAADGSEVVWLGCEAIP